MHWFRTAVEKGMKLCTAVLEGYGYKGTARASLLCSVGKIFHRMHYLSAAARISHNAPFNEASAVIVGVVRITLRAETSVRRTAVALTVMPVSIHASTMAIKVPADMSGMATSNFLEEWRSTPPNTHCSLSGWSL